MLNQQQLANAVDRDLRGSDGEKIGTVVGAFVDPTTGTPDWLSVKTGILGGRSLVPADLADVTEDGVTVPFTKADVKDSPDVDDSQGALSQEDAETLRAHYRQLPASRSGSAEATTDQAAPHPSDDEAMTVSEERLRVDKETVDAGEATLRKHVVTEEHTITVPVTHEEVRLERTPVDPETRPDTAEIGEDEQSVRLTEERLVVTKETVPVEQVQLVKDQVTEDRQVNETLRHEEVETTPELPTDG